MKGLSCSRLSIFALWFLAWCFPFPNLSDALANGEQVNTESFRQVGRVLLRDLKKYFGSDQRSGLAHEGQRISFDEFEKILDRVEVVRSEEPIFASVAKLAGGVTSVASEKLDALNNCPDKNRSTDFRMNVRIYSKNWDSLLQESRASLVKRIVLEKMIFHEIVQCLIEPGRPGENPDAFYSVQKYVEELRNGARSLADLRPGIYRIVDSGSVLFAAAQLGSPQIFLTVDTKQNKVVLDIYPDHQSTDFCLDCMSSKADVFKPGWFKNLSEVRQVSTEVHQPAQDDLKVLLSGIFQGRSSIRLILRVIDRDTFALATPEVIAGSSKALMANSSDSDAESRQEKNLVIFRRQILQRSPSVADFIFNPSGVFASGERDSNGSCQSTERRARGELARSHRLLSPSLLLELLVLNSKATWAKQDVEFFSDWGMLIHSSDDTAGIVRERGARPRCTRTPSGWFKISSDHRVFETVEEFGSGKTEAKADCVVRVSRKYILPEFSYCSRTFSELEKKWKSEFDLSRELDKAELQSLQGPGVDQ